ncbi:MAG: hypothetical protein WAT20_07845 [Ferruginibacter sp.]|nr:hypothetical protein [Chitinophagaceae bacterium]
MKRTNKLSWFFAFVLMFGINTTSFSQTLKEVFNDSESPLTYLGIDFSKTKLLDLGNADDIRNRLYGSINDLIVLEPKKFDLKGAFRNSNINHDFGAVSKNISKVNSTDILSTNMSDFDRFKESDIAAVVNALDLSGKNGVGLLFVMEAMRKVDKKGDAAIWVTLVDMKTKKVLMTERMITKATGIGFRNYWASTIKEVIEEINKKKYKDWRNKYGS